MDFPDKSGTQPPKKEIKPVVSHVEVAKRPATRKFMDVLFSESPRDIVKRIGREVVVPHIKDGLFLAGNSFLAGMLGQDGSPRPLGSMMRGTVLRGGASTYSAISTMSNPAMVQAMAASQQRPAGSYADIVCATMQEAELILANLYDLLNQYRMVSVADLKELTSQSTENGDDAYGWTSLEQARISKVRTGFLLELPRTTLIT